MEKPNTPQTTTANEATQPALIDARQLGKLLGVSLRTVRNLQARREIPFYRIGGSIKFDYAAVMTELGRKFMMPAKRSISAKGVR